MADDKKVRIGSEVDATGAKKGFDKIKADAKGMADEVKKAGQSAGQGLGKGVGAGAEEGAKKINKANSALNQSIRRQIGALQRQLAEQSSGAARGTRQYFQEYAKLRGADIKKLEANLRELESVERRVSAALQNTTRDTQVAGHAVGNLAAQFQDVAVTAQMGMSPLMIALQQGTQISAALGQSGAAGAVATLGAAFGSIFSPLSLFTIGITAAIAAGIQLAAAMFESGESAKSLDERITAFNGTLQELKTNTVSTTKDMDDLEEKYGKVDKRVLGLIGSLQKYNRLELKQNLQDLVSGFTGEVEDIFGAGAFGFTLDLDFTKGPQATARARLKGELEITEQAARKLEKAFIDLSTAKGLENQEQALSNVRQLLEGLAGDEPNKKMRDLNKTVATLLLNFIEYRNAIKDTAPEKEISKTEKEYRKLTKTVHKNIAENNKLASQLSKTKRSMGDSAYQTAIFKRQIELTTAAKKAGIPITAELARAYRQMAVDEAEAAKKVSDAQKLLDKDPKLGFFDAASKGAEDWAKKYENSSKSIREAIVGTFDSATDAVTNFVMTGKADIADFTKSVLADFLRIALRAAIIQPIAGALFGGAGGAGGAAAGGSAGTVASARGNAFSGGQVQAFANGGVFSSPITFPMSGGRTGLMAEAGPEAIMPLDRDAKGRLGVRTQGGQGVKINFQLVNQSSQPLTKQSQQAFFDEDLKAYVVRTVISDYTEGGKMRDLIGDR